MRRSPSIAALCILALQFLSTALIAEDELRPMHEPHRPQVHFSPAANWMNDPNGLVYHNGVYHLFFQHHPASNVWGPMHWGHATSADLVHWEQQPIALYPDSLGTIFSGSAVVDKDNTSGFGVDGRAPLVAIFTQHDAESQKAGKKDFENQSIAYSTDDGKTWTKYSGNPVVKNPGIRDFRDPKFFWYAASKKWIMTLATSDCVTFFSSPDLKTWQQESEFGRGVGAHEGVWECPDLIELPAGSNGTDSQGKKVWALLVSLGSGAPNGGAGTQYFLGTFDGTTFASDRKEARWLDYGPDDYAGITWSNTGDRTIFIGWMANPMYAGQVPTEKWRSALTLPRDLKLAPVGDQLFLASKPVPELAALREKPTTISNLPINKTLDLADSLGKVQFPCELNLKFDAPADFSLVLSNDANEQLVVGYEKSANEFFIDRTKSGITGFNKHFASRHTVPRFATGEKLKLTLIIDTSSIELFADDGLSVMSEIFFPTKPYTDLRIDFPDRATISELQYAPLKSIWP